MPRAQRRLGSLVVRVRGAVSKCRGSRARLCPCLRGRVPTTSRAGVEAEQLLSAAGSLPTREQAGRLHFLMPLSGLPPHPPSRSLRPQY